MNQDTMELFESLETSPPPIPSIPKRTVTTNTNTNTTAINNNNNNNNKLSQEDKKITPIKEKKQLKEDNNRKKIHSTNDKKLPISPVLFKTSTSSHKPSSPIVYKHTNVVNNCTSSIISNTNKENKKIIISPTRKKL
jgi:hypothetical protein